MAASTLCSNADTNAMRCLRNLAIDSDARVPAACAEALMAGVNPRLKARKEATRSDRLFRLLNEATPTCTGVNNCPSFNSNAGVRCNDFNNGQCRL